MVNLMSNITRADYENVRSLSQESRVNLDQDQTDSSAIVTAR